MVKRGLGKGLDALFSGETLDDESKQGLTELKITEIEPNRGQPRKNFDAEQLKALSESIREHGVIQPVIVSAKENGFYRLVAGERRWRAAKMAGLKTIPAIIGDYGGERTMELALVENLQREDLNPIEEAEGYQRLSEDFGLTQEQISAKIGKSRPAIANALRLLTLSDSLKDAVRGGRLTSGHARALLAVDDEGERQRLAERAIEEQMSVRELERIVNSGKTKVPVKKENKYDAEIRYMEDKLSSLIGTRVRIINGQKKGKIEIEYYSNDDLSRILSYFG